MIIVMCCGMETSSIEISGDMKKLMSSVVRKKRFNRNRRHPSMCIDAVLTSTIRLLKNEEVRQKLLQSKGIKRPSTFSTTSRPKRKRSRWDMKTKEPRRYEVDNELDQLTGMDSFFQRLKGISCDTGRSDGDVNNKEDKMATDL